MPVVRHHDRFTAYLIVLALSAAAISILNSFWSERATPRFDEEYYLELAENIAGGSYVDGYMVRPPLYPLFLAGVFKIFGPHFAPALVLQAILRGFVVAGIALMGRRYVSRQAGLISASILVFYPHLIQTYTRFMTEAVYIPLFLLSFYLLEKLVATESLADAVKAGIGCGVASLARSTSFFLTFLVCIWLVLNASGSGRFSRSKAMCAAGLLIMFMVTVSPWTVRNVVTHGGFIAISNDSAFNLYLVVSGKGYGEGAKEWETWGTQVERQREGYRRWLNHLRVSHDLHVRRFVSGLRRLLLPEWGERLPAPVAEAMASGSGAQATYLRVFGALRPVIHLLLLMGGLVGLFVVERNASRRNLVLLVFFYLVLAHGATLPRVRFLVPMNTLLAVYCGGLVTTLISIRCPQRRQ